MAGQLGGHRPFCHFTYPVGDDGGAAKEPVFEDLWLLCDLYFDVPLYDQHRHDHRSISGGRHPAAVLQLWWILTLVIHHFAVYLHQNGQFQSFATRQNGLRNQQFV